MGDTAARDLVVEMVGLNKWYGQHHVLRDITLGLAKGEKMVLCGPSGSGKSTLIRCVNGLEAYHEGDLQVGPTRLDGTQASLATVRSRVGMVFQNFNLFPHLTVLQNLTLGAVYARGEPEHRAIERAHELLERVRLSLADRQVSGATVRRPAPARGDCPRADAGA
ncbi:ATP-binding cassette domain-containing protein [Jiella pelagia]|uniref:ATP-binding cassette domain-containing protein n=1 Tax=Jiella pelagia TaxID=2986949 RepID=A0ABY7BZ53_9HYPH|nr:ATP-binding cassette domain-containing protein [Jiella pelagia]